MIKTRPRTKFKKGAKVRLTKSAKRRMGYPNDHLHTHTNIVVDSDHSVTTVRFPNCARLIADMNRRLAKRKFIGTSIPSGIMKGGFWTSDLEAAPPSRP